jgi:hypothetical protein
LTAAAIRDTVKGYDDPFREGEPMKKHHAFALLVIAFAVACQESRGPMAPAEAPLAGPVAEVAACPCWDGGMLGVAFPTVHFFLEAGGTAALTRFDHADAQQLQALVQFAPDGAGSCELASYGTAGLVETLASARDLSPAQCAACAALLEGSAAAFGFAAPAADAAAAD